MKLEQLTKIQNEVNENSKRFYMYDYIMGVVALVDSEEEIITLFESDSKGRIFNVITKKIDGRLKAGLKRRLNGNYGLHNSKIIDSYIYYHMFNREIQENCKYKPGIGRYDYIGNSDSLEKSLKIIVDYLYNYDNNGLNMTAEEQEKYKSIIKEKTYNFINNYK